MVFQKPNPFPKSIYDNVAYGPRLHGMARTAEELKYIVEDALRAAAQQRKHRATTASPSGPWRARARARTASAAEAAVGRCWGAPLRPWPA